MAATLVKRFKSVITPSITVSCFRGQKGFFYTINKSNYKKESNQWEDTPFFHASDLFAMSAALAKAQAWAEENPFKRDESAQEAPAEQVGAPVDQKLRDMEDIPF